MPIPATTRTVFASLALLLGGTALGQSQPQSTSPPSQQQQPLQVQSQQRQPPQNAVPPPSTLEPATALTSMAQLDANKDGFIDKNEVPSGHELAGKFARLDRNSDGKLDASEFAAYQEEKR
ncbi:EF-hand domain-containing protein [Tahibacter caeni]|uniref:EF-hand domain-containing protein n=1 Tax=Tahibacter caeni TaxID=1453545 RepID=UPI0021488C6C|nr:EF-hand domain-containing protein [Tahibacter caeni]